MSVKITGAGIISVYGDNPEMIAENIKINKMPFGEKILVKGKEFYRIKDFDHRPYLGDKGLRFWDPSALLIGSAVKKALDESKVLEKYKPEEICFALGKVKAEYMQMEFIKSVLADPVFGPNPGMIPNLSSNAVAGQVAMKFCFRGENITFSNSRDNLYISYLYASNKIKRNLSDVYCVVSSFDYINKNQKSNVVICIILEAVPVEALNENKLKFLKFLGLHF